MEVLEAKQPDREDSKWVDSMQDAMHNLAQEGRVSIGVFWRYSAEKSQMLISVRLST